MKTLTEVLKWRYTTKEYDENKKIDSKLFQEIESILQLSPTSTNLQPLHFIIADTEVGKKRIAKAASGNFSFNEAKILKASHVIVFASKLTVEEQHLKKVIEQEDQDGRFATVEMKEQMDLARHSFVNVHRFTLKDESQWHAKQSYITFGAVLLGAAQLGIDATPIEGIDASVLEEEFDLHEQGFVVNAVIALGYRKDEMDFNASLPKSRLEKKDIITKI